MELESRNPLTFSSSAIAYATQFGNLFKSEKTIDELGIEKCQKILKELGKVISASEDRLQWSDIKSALGDNHNFFIIKENLIVIADMFQIPENQILDRNSQLLDKIKKNPSFEAALSRDDAFDKLVKSVLEDIGMINKCFLELYKGVDYVKEALSLAIVNKSLNEGLIIEAKNDFVNKVLINDSKEPTVVTSSISNKASFCFLDTLINYQKFYKENSSVIKSVYEKYYSVINKINEWKENVTLKTKLKKKNDISQNISKLVSLAFNVSSAYMEIGASTFQQFFLDLPQLVTKLENELKIMETSIKEFRKNYNYFAYCCATDQAPNSNTAWLYFLKEFGLSKMHRFMYAELSFVNGHLCLIDSENTPSTPKKSHLQQSTQRILVEEEHQDRIQVDIQNELQEQLKAFADEPSSLFNALENVSDSDIQYITEIFNVASSRFNVPKNMVLSSQVLQKKIKEIPSVFASEKCDTLLLESIKGIRSENEENKTKVSLAYLKLQKETDILNGEAHFSSFKDVLLEYQQQYKEVVMLQEYIIEKINNLLKAIDERFNKGECKLVELANSLVNPKISEMTSNLDKFINSLPKTIVSEIQALFEFALDFEHGQVEEAITKYRPNAEKIATDLKLLLQENQETLNAIIKYTSAYNFFAYCCASDMRPKKYWWGYKENENDYARTKLQFGEDGHLLARAPHNPTQYPLDGFESGTEYEEGGNFDKTSSKVYECDDDFTA